MRLWHWLFHRDARRDDRGSQRNKVEEEVEERTSATSNQRPASGYTGMHRETLRFAEKKNVGINY
jgi:hypothetical protein